MTRVLPKRNLSAEQTDRWYSPNIWGGCPIEAIENGTVRGRFFQDDFTGPCPNTDAGLFEGAGESKGLGYLFYGDTGVTMKAQAAVEEGVVEVAGNNLDNDEGTMSTVSPSWIISDTASEAKKLWFEARVKKASITDEALGMFVGLGWDHTAGVSVAQAECLTDDEADLGAWTDVNLYVTEPCRHYWGEIESHRETARRERQVPAFRSTSAPSANSRRSSCRRERPPPEIRDRGRDLLRYPGRLRRGAWRDAWRGR